MTRETTYNEKLAGGKQVQVGNYRFTGKDLGKGSFAFVREAIHIHLRAHVSVKIIDLRKCNSYMLKNFLREAAILKDLDHPYIMRLFETMKCDNMYYMVTELVQGGDLCAFVQQKRGRVEEIVTRRFSRQIASALKYLHNKGIVHRDLKLENVMLDSAKRNVKLIDFGLTNHWSLDSPLKTLCGSPEYSAPELFVPGTVYGPEVDMWAFGVIMFAMAAGRLPFPCLSEIMKVPEKKTAFLKTINKGLSEAQTKLINSYSSDFTMLIKGLMNPNWDERLTITEVFRDPWMTNKDHWVDALHDSLDSFDLDDIIQSLSSKLKTTESTLRSELKIRPCGEAGGFFNIMSYQELHRRFQPKPSTKLPCQSETQVKNSFVRGTPPKKRSKQVVDCPIKLSLPGNDMKLNEVPYAMSLMRRGDVHTPTSTVTSNGSSKLSDNLTNKPNRSALPQIKSLKSSCPSPLIEITRDEPKTPNKGSPTSSSLKRRLKIKRIILPSKIETTSSGKSLWQQKQTWQEV